MNPVQREFAQARRALADLAEIAPLLAPDSAEQARKILADFCSAARALHLSATNNLKPAYADLAPRWLAAFHSHPDRLRSAFRARKLGTPPPRKPGESDSDHLRRSLALTLAEHGKKETLALIKEAEAASSQAAAPIDPTLVPDPDSNAFLKQLGLLSRPEARELLLAQKPKFLRKIAAQRRIPFSGEADSAFIQKLHESARRFSRNTAI